MTIPDSKYQALLNEQLARRDCNFFTSPLANDYSSTVFTVQKAGTDLPEYSSKQAAIIQVGEQSAIQVAD